MLPFLLASLLSATLVTARDVASGELVTRRVTIRGVVAAAVRDDLDDGFNWILLKTPDGTVCASSDNHVHPLDELLPLLDAEVELTGTVQRFSNWRKFLGCQMLFDNPAEGDRLTVLKPAPKDPFAAPPLTDTAYPHRQTATGTVIARTDDSFFLRRTNDVLRVRPVDTDGMPPPGAQVTASGFGEQNPPFRQLIGAIWRTASGETVPPEQPTNLLARQLFKTDYLSPESKRQHRYADMAFNGMVIRLTGRVDAIVRSEPIRTGLRLDCDGESIFVDLSGFDPEGLPLPELDAEIAVSGLYFADFDTGRNTIFPRLLGFTVIPRTAEDLRVVKAAPWWTTGRLFAAIAVLLALVGVFAGWTAALRRVSARRARELVREQIAGARAELKVEERTRLAVELHDSLSQTLTGVALQIDAALKCGTGMPESSRTVLQTARRMLASCRHELKCCLWDLRTRIFDDKDMTDAVRRTVTPHVGETTVSVRFNVPRRRLSDNTAHTILRIIRELSINAVRHGGARHLKIAGEFRDGLVRCSVQDDGRGFDLPTAPGPAQGHFGLQGIRERLRERQGEMSVQSTPGKGSRFVITLPSDEEPS